MAKTYKYKYNPETLSYDKIEVSFKERSRKWFIYFGLSIVMTVVYYFLIFQHIDTPRQAQLEAKVQALKDEYHLRQQELASIDRTLFYIQQRDDNLYRTVLEVNPISNAKRMAGFGGVNRYKVYEGYENSDAMISLAKHIDQITKQLYVQSLSYDELINKARRKEELLLSRPSIRPIAGSKMPSAYGLRLHPIFKVYKMHTGVDFGAPRGTKVYATANGKVTRADSDNRGYGKLIVVNHGNGYETYYAHLNAYDVKVGDKVKRGQVIGRVGSTGYSTSPHLHYEVRLNGQHTNPINFFYSDITPDEYIEIERESHKVDLYEKW